VVDSKEASALSKVAVGVSIAQEATEVAAAYTSGDTQQVAIETAGGIGSVTGSLAGSAAGAKAGAAIGSVLAPGVGTIVGGVAGGFFGGNTGESITEGLAREFFDDSEQVPQYRCCQRVLARTRLSTRPVFRTGPNFRGDLRSA
tara:strand:- start:1573 stop:2004 length:432 start_codon:yes stop_codon:yes gene_type:complete